MSDPQSKKGVTRAPNKLRALREFRAALDIARSEFEANKLDGSLAALISVVRLMIEIDPDDKKSHRVMFMTLASVLGDLSNGRETPPWFRRPLEKASRGVDNAETWLMRANAAATMDYLIVGGMTKPSAARAVSRLVAATGFKCGKETVSEWRRQLKEGYPAAEDGTPPGFAVRRYLDLTRDNDRRKVAPLTEGEQKRELDRLAEHFAHHDFMARK